MKIVWLVNAVLPQIARITGSSASCGGGWLESLLADLCANEANALTLLYPDAACREDRAGNLRCLSFPLAQTGEHPGTEALFSRVLAEEAPDVIHIWGTEYAHTLEMVNACEKAGLLERALVSIQGLCSVCADHFYNGLPGRVVRSESFRDLLRRDGLRAQRNKLALRGVNEVAALKKARHVVGRTDWDETETAKINPARAYHFCNETLRPSFYTRRWALKGCTRHALFAVGGWPIKGMHHAIDTLSALLADYPDTTLAFTGADPRRVPWVRRGAYQNYLIEKLRALPEGSVRFLGSLDEGAMCAQFLRSHVFLSPSSIENSPNSVGEAMLLGVPTAAFDAGGTHCLLNAARDGVLCPVGDTAALAAGVRAIFADDALAQGYSENAHAHAAETHNREKNLETLLSIYRSLAGGAPC